MLRTAAWLPLSIYCLERAVGASRPRPRWLVAGAAVLALTLLAGHTQTAMYALYLGAAYALWRARERGHGLAVGLAAAALPALLAAGLAAIQLVPTVELVAISTRDRLPYDAAAYGYELKALPGALLPAWRGERALYVGVPILLLAALALSARSRAAVFWGAVVGVRAAGLARREHAALPGPLAGRAGLVDLPRSGAVGRGLVARRGRPGRPRPGRAARARRRAASRRLGPAARPRDAGQPRLRGRGGRPLDGPPGRGAEPVRLAARVGRLPGAGARADDAAGRGLAAARPARGRPACWSALVALRPLHGQRGEQPERPGPERRAGARGSAGPAARRGRAVPAALGRRQAGPAELRDGLADAVHERRQPDSAAPDPRPARLARGVAPLAAVQRQVPAQPRRAERPGPRAGRPDRRPAGLRGPLLAPAGLGGQRRAGRAGRRRPRSRLLLSEGIHPGDTAVVAEAPALPIQPGLPRPDVRVRSVWPNGLEVEARSTGNALLVVADAWHPGWRADLDGAPVADRARPTTRSAGSRSRPASTS